MNKNLFYMQVQVFAINPRNKEEKTWQVVRPSKGKPYAYETREEAEHMLSICYPNFSLRETRVIESSTIPD